MKNSIKLSTTYDFPINEVWEALTNKTAMSEWLMPCNLEPIPDYKFQFQTKSYPGFDGIINCVVLEVVKHKRFSFSWSGGSLKNTKVIFNLTEDGDKITLDFEHNGFKGLINQLIICKILSNGWKTKILVSLLPNYLSTHERHI